MCFCVQDTPENPCTCIDLPIWINTQPIDISKTGKKTRDGRDIVEFTLPKETEVFVDLQVPFKLKDLELIAKKSRQRRKQDCDGTTVGAAPPLNWLGLAAAAGYAVGSMLDDLAGSNEGGNDNLSDDLSDWAADNFPAPGWLQDLF